MNTLNKILTAAFALIILVFTVGFVVDGTTPVEEYEWQQITVIESVVPGGLGRSRMISTNESGKMEEEKLQNFFSITGINFGNINENDLKITDKVSKLTARGWELYNVTSGVYGVEGKTGIFITRYMFRKTK